MKDMIQEEIRTLVLPYKHSHKGQNGRLLVIGGSRLFHAASLWALEVASRIVDLVHYASVPENNELVLRIKEEFRNGIVVSRDDIEAYIHEDDCILIGPGMTRDEETRSLTHQVLTEYPNKQWVIDAGALQMLRLEDIPQHAILTPHEGEFKSLCDKSQISNLKNQAISNEQKVKQFSKQYDCIVLLKGQVDTISNGKEVREIEGGNEGMTKGGTGDVLAGLVAALACKNDPLLAAIAGSYINKQAGDTLYERVGPFFNASDLAGQIPKTLHDLFF